MTQTSKTRALVEGAIMVVIAHILGYIVLWKMPWGGSVCLAMLPIFIYAYRYGVKHGLLAGFVLGILEFTVAGGISIGWQSIIGDYLLAFMVLGLAGLCRKNIFVGAIIGAAARFVVHYVVGATVWAAYMPETFFGLTMTTPWFYSFLYNIGYMAVSLILCLVALALLKKPLAKYLVVETQKA